MVSYNSKKIIPGPLVTINKNYRKNSDDGTVGTTYGITLNGTLLPLMGSPSGSYTTLDGAFWILNGYPPDDTFISTDVNFNHILRKQEAIRHLFREDGKSLEWQNSIGQPVVKCNPRVQSINFDEGRGQWTDGCDFTINLEAEAIYINGTLSVEDTTAMNFIDTVSETWNFEEIQGTNASQYRVTHNISAQGIKGYDENGNLYGNKPAWVHAKDYVLLRSSGFIDPAIMYAGIGSSGWLGGAYTRNTEVDKKSGSFSVTENWILQENLTAYIEKSFSAEYNGDTNEYSVKYNGVIHGFVSGVHEGNINAVNNARSFIPTNAQARIEASGAIGTIISPYIVPEFPTSKSFVINNQNGTINFAFDWNPNYSTNITSEFEATTGFEAEQGIYNLSLNQEIIGYNSDISQRLSDVKGSILTDDNAFVKALDLTNGVLASGYISPIIKSKTSVLNERRGTGRSSWSWDSSTNSNGLEITVRTQLPSNVFASIPIVGRSTGPIIQRMNTTTSEIIDVTINGVNQSTQPDGRSLADAQIANIDNYIVTSQEESYNQQKKTYNYRASYIKKT